LGEAEIFRKPGLKTQISPYWEPPILGLLELKRKGTKWNGFKPKPFPFFGRNKKFLPGLSHFLFCWVSYRIFARLLFELYALLPSSFFCKRTYSSKYLLAFFPGLFFPNKSQDNPRLSFISFPSSLEPGFPKAFFGQWKKKPNRPKPFFLKKKIPPKNLMEELGWNSFPGIFKNLFRKIQSLWFRPKGINLSKGLFPISKLNRLTFWFSKANRGQ